MSNCEYTECPLCGRGGWTDERKKTEIGYVCSSCVLKRIKGKLVGGCLNVLNYYSLACRSWSLYYPTHIS